MNGPCDYAQVAAALVGGEPLAHKPYPDGSLVVIAPNGGKYKFSPEQVAAGLSALAPKASKPSRRTSQTGAKRPAAKQGIPATDDSVAPGSSAQPQG